MFYVHLRFRRLSPRRLPPFTPLKLPEIYGALCLQWTLSNATTLLQVEQKLDPELRTIFWIEMICQRVSQVALDATKLQDEMNSDNYKLQFIPMMRPIRENKYRNSSLFGKLMWWHNHFWSDEATWMQTAFLWKAVFGLSGFSPEDLDICITHIANTRLRNSTTSSFSNYGMFPFNALVSSIPLAIAVRSTRLPLLFRPMNGIQRALVGATIYFTTMQNYQHYAYLKTLKDPSSIKRAIEAALASKKKGAKSG
ncbi:hypothetical protein C8Q79DRAFT_331454 [Trametes meyenii]|nr:hypothetical protein C8Q79DRAFT_331454 [Trametes meyenii]